MKLNTFYFFMALFIGFFVIYVYKSDYFVIMKNKKCMDNKMDCYN